MNTQIPAAISIQPEALARLCRRWGIVRLELFGSVLRKDFDPQRSDVDVMATFAPDAHPGWAVFSEIPAELSRIFGRPVDFLERDGLEQSANHRRRRQIFENSLVVYEG